MGGTSYAVFTTGGSGGGGTSTTPFQEVPAGLVNGSNVTYTLTHVPSSAAAVEFYIDGLILSQGIGLDYTISGAVITTTTAPLPAQVPYAVYSY